MSLESRLAALVQAIGLDVRNRTISPQPYIASPTVTNLRNAMIAAGVMMPQAATAPVNSVAPAISGTGDIGAVLTCAPGTWVGTAPITYAYQWRNGASNIAGATSASYTVATAAGASITCRVTATNAAGSANVISNAIVAKVYIPPETGDHAVFGPSNGNITVSNGGLRAHKSTNNDPPHYGHCAMDKPITGLAYFEVDSTWNPPYGSAAVINFYGGTLTPADYPVDSALGYWSGQPGASIGLTSEWSAIGYANYGLPNELGTGSLILFDRNPSPVTRRFQFAVNAGTRQIWVRTAEAPAGWVGGGDPAAGTSPTLILGGTGAIYAGATSAQMSNVLDLILPDNHVGTPPAGFTAGIF